MNKYIIGIDGGGTKTLGILWDENQKEINKYQTGFSNFAVSKELTNKHIEETITELTKGINQKIDVVIGVSGYSNLLNKDEYINKLEKKFNINLTIESDGYLALNSVVTTNPVIMVIGGTGSIGYSLYNNKVHKMGGYGHLLGDEGSAYHVVIKAFKYLIKYYESHNKLDSFCKKIMNELNINDVEEIKPLVYGTNNKSEVAKYSKIISKIANEGNRVAIKLLIEEGKSLGNLITNLYKKMNSNKTVTIALRGGFLNNVLVVKNSLIETLNKNNLNYLIDEENNEPIIGAYYIAIKDGGKR